MKLTSVTQLDPAVEATDEKEVEATCRPESLRIQAEFQSEKVAPPLKSDETTAQDSDRGSFDLTGQNVAETVGASNAAEMQHPGGSMFEDARAIQLGRRGRL